MPIRENLSPREKAAILLVSLGKEYSAKIYKCLTEDEIEQLTLSITSVRRVLPETKDAVLQEFLDMCIAQKYISEGGIDYARDVLRKAMGDQKADEIIVKLSSSLQVRPFDFVRKVDGNQVTSFVQNEHPQTVALILSYLEPKQSAAVLASLSPVKQTDVVARIATMGATTPEYVKEVERVLERKLSSATIDDQTQVGGIDSIVKILNSVDRSTEKNILETLERNNKELAEQIRNRMFIFEDIVRLSPQSIQRVLKEIDNRDLALALKGTTKEVSKVIFDNISSRLVEMIKEDMEFMGPVRVREVEEVQQKIVNTIRRLDDEGEIMIDRKEDEVIV